MSEVEKIPALGISVQIDLGAGRAAVFQSAIDRDCSADDVNGLLDKINRAGDRQRAHYKIDEEERTIELLENEQRQHAEDMERIELDYVKAQNEREDQIVAAERSRSNWFEAKRAGNAAAGRRGEYEPRGVEKTELAAIERGVLDLRASITNAKAERDVAQGRYAETTKRRGEVIARHVREIARCKAIVAGNAV